jgi:hypothetical protein
MMIYGEPFFEIAVYRKTPEILRKEQEALFEKQVRWVESRLPANFAYRSSETYKHSEHGFFEKNGSPYPYNQVIGWVVLVASRNQILAEYFKITGVRLGRHCRRHPMKWQGKAFEIYLERDETNDEILNEVLRELRLLSIKGPFKNRYLDTDAFEKLAPFTDLRRLIDSSK